MRNSNTKIRKHNHKHALKLNCTVKKSIQSLSVLLFLFYSTIFQSKFSLAKWKTKSRKTNKKQNKKHKNKKAKHKKTNIIFIISNCFSSYHCFLYTHIIIIICHFFSSKPIYFFLSVRIPAPSSSVACYHNQNQIKNKKQNRTHTTKKKEKY